MTAYRKATMDDAVMLLQWRNDEETVRNFRTNRPVTQKEHEAWLRGRLRDADRPVFICYDHNGAVGTVHLTKIEDKENGFETSVTVAPEARGHGYGGKMLKAVCEDYPTATLYTEVKEGNVASMKSFGAAGFVQIGSNGTWTQWRRMPLK